MNKRLELLEIAFSFYGMKEIPGEQDNPNIVMMFRNLGYSWINDDETPWCAAFVNYCLKLTSLPYTGKLNARSFSEWGIETNMPRVGDVVVFNRGSDPAKGHVAFFIKEDDEHVYVLGGNQANQVNISRYPVSRKLHYRTLAYI